MFSQPSLDMDSGEEGGRRSVPVCLSVCLCVKDTQTLRCDVNSVSVSTLFSLSCVFLLSFLTFRCWNAALRKFLF